RWPPPSAATTSPKTKTTRTRPPSSREPRRFPRTGTARVTGTDRLSRWWTNEKSRALSTIAISGDWGPGFLFCFGVVPGGLFRTPFRRAYRSRSRRPHRDFPRLSRKSLLDEGQPCVNVLHRPEDG